MVGLEYSGMYDPKELIAIAKEAEPLGINSIAIAQQAGYRDAFIIAAWLAKETQRVKLIPGVISPYSQHPMTIAVSAATLNELAPGRFELIIGTGGHQQEAYGVKIEKPLATMRESIEVIRALLDGEIVDYCGERFQFDSAKLGIDTTALPIYMAAIGPKMQKTAGACADGIVFSAAHSPKFIRRSVERVRKARASSERAGLPFRYLANILCSVDPDPREAYKRTKDTLSYLFSSPFKAEDWALNDVSVDYATINAAREQGELEIARGLVSDELAKLFTASGSPSEFQERIQLYCNSGIDLPMLIPLGTHEQKMLALQLALEVLSSCD